MASDNQTPCRMMGCDRPRGEQDRDDYNDHKFCSVQCQVKYEHIRADARDAERADRERHTEERVGGARR